MIRRGARLKHGKIALAANGRRIKMIELDDA